MRITPIYRTMLVREGSTKTEAGITGTNHAKAVAIELLDGSPCEQFWVILLDTKNKIIGAAMITQGTLDSSLVHPREVFRPAILANAANIIIAHNHPSGDMTPSKEDQYVYARLQECGKQLGIPVLDSIITGDREAFSMAAGD